VAESAVLTLAFLETHPDDAARVLEHLANEQVAALLDSVPVRLAAPVLAHLLPAVAARSLAQLSDESAAGMVQRLGPQLCAVILRHLDEARRNSLLERLPTATAFTVRVLLAYPEDSVGAWMDNRAMALLPDTPVEEALERVREAGEEDCIDVYIVDHEQHLLGKVRLPDLLRAPAAAPLAQLMRKPAHTLPARAPIASVREHEGWERYNTLPVVERGERFVGALHHAMLRNAVQRRQEAAPVQMNSTALDNLAGTYWLVFSGLIQAFIGLFTGSAALHAKDHTHER
jgi:magnesium transporter